MSKANGLEHGGLLHEFFQAGLYKRSQGRIARQVTFAVIGVTVGLGAWRMLESDPFTYSAWFQGAKYLFPGLIALIGFWIGYRVVNLPKFADFLIAVEAEMNKVSWPSRAELIRSSLVVIFVIFAMAFILFAYDIVWSYVFRLLGVVYQQSDSPAP